MSKRIQVCRLTGMATGSTPFTCSSSTFAYSEQDIAKILEGVGGDDFPSSGVPPLDDCCKQLLFKQKKELNIHMHITALAQYVKSKRIPRGLRLSIQPNLCTEDPVLIQRWQEICNKCSIDLMVLTIERLQEKASSVGLEVSALKEQVIAAKGSAQADAVFSEQGELLRKHREAVSARKARKYERDALDYVHNKVYTWQEDRSIQRTMGENRGRFRRQQCWQYRSHYNGRRSPRDSSTDSMGGFSSGSEFNRSGDTAIAQPEQYSQHFYRASQQTIPAPFLDQRTQKKNPRFPIPREAYPQRNKAKR
ncbi:uncharacterized protein LOC121397630 [Xenopus laevis]|uniref:Uncharacterized protein LOC121397630 n=1 Tax=Xenopus laevis TaxID=8355 RepID=A0A8J1LM18_XENLA|nr:uncharacterized protein LOC121397630 [Xenopus laevis]